MLARFPMCYNSAMSNLTITEVARMGGLARAKKLTKEQLSAIGKKGGDQRIKKAKKRRRA